MKKQGTGFATRVANRNLIRQSKNRIKACIQEKAAVIEDYTMIKNLRENAIGATGSVSGIASVLGSWQVCHNVCLGIIVILGVLGITVAGMPLAFLTKVAVPFWIIAFALLLVIIGLYVKKKCISSNLIIFNSGLIIAGIPFKALQGFNPLFWIIGGTLVSISVFVFVKGKIQIRRQKK